MGYPPGMAWFKKDRKPIEPPADKSRVPEGLWEKCDRCGVVLYRPELEENLEVCPKCSFHMPIRARARLAIRRTTGSSSFTTATSVWAAAPGQAAVFFAPYARTVTILVRGKRVTIAGDPKQLPRLGF
mgnify:CR=1 FL=1